MMDITFIREHLQEYKKCIQDKNVSLDVERLLGLDDERKNLQKKIDDLRSEKNETAKILQDPQKRSPEMIERGKKIKDASSALESSYEKIMEEYRALLLLTPNVPSADTPVGKDAEANVEIDRWGNPRGFDFEPKDHLTLGKDLDILDLERGVKVAGFRGYFLKGAGAEMHMAVLQYAFNTLVAKGFIPHIVPTIVLEDAMVNMGQLPTHKKETYQLLSHEQGAEESTYLAGTAEVGLLNQYAGEIMDKKDLPLKICGFSPCFRSEAGSYGKDTKGLYRVHEFMKIEQLIITENDLAKSLDYLEELRGISEHILKELELPYRVVICSTGDQGVGKHKMYDIETWMPSRAGYGETHSDSLLTDWQARRANIRYKDGAEMKFVHTLNNTAIASPRILIALWENYQNADGSITVPDVLRPYMSGKSIIKKS